MQRRPELLESFLDIIKKRYHEHIKWMFARFQSRLDSWKKYADDNNQIKHLSYNDRKKLGLVKHRDPSKQKAKKPENHETGGSGKRKKLEPINSDDLELVRIIQSIDDLEDTEKFSKDLMEKLNLKRPSEIYFAYKCFVDQFIKREPYIHQNNDPLIADLKKISEEMGEQSIKIREKYTLKNRNDVNDEELCPDMSEKKPDNIFPSSLDISDNMSIFSRYYED